MVALVSFDSTDSSLTRFLLGGCLSADRFKTYSSSELLASLSSSLLTLCILILKSPGDTGARNEAVIAMVDYCSTLGLWVGRWVGLWVGLRVGLRVGDHSLWQREYRENNRFRWNTVPQLLNYIVGFGAA